MRTFTHVLILSFLFLCTTSFGQGTQVEFGKNRVQYHQDFAEWSQYESRNFITFWYGEGRNIGQSVVQIAELDYESIQNILEHRMNDKIEIIVYKDLTDLKQSNIGSEETFINTGGQTKIVGNKIFVYFDGNHANLRRNIREGVANVYMNAMLFGANLQEIVQNAVMMNLPTWFKDGLVSYVGEEWSTEKDNQLRDIILQGEYKSFDRLAEDYPKLAGHSMWYYISQNYGRSTVSNLLYLTRINRSIDSGFLYVLGSTYKKTMESWMRYFDQRYKAESQAFSKPEPREIKFKNKRKLPITEVKINPSGQKVAYVVNEIGKFKLYLQDIRSGERELILKEGFRNAFQATDYNYPILAWNPNNQSLTIIYEERDVIKIMYYDINTKEKIEDVIPNQYHRIFSAEHINTSKLVLSASVRGYSDLFIFNTKNRQTERLTNDFYDDLEATVLTLDGKRGVLFASNRQDSILKPENLDTILPISTFDLFFYDLEERGNELVRVTRTPLANEMQPIAVDSTWFSYLSDESGIYNRRMGYLEDYIAYYEKVILLEDSTEIVLHQDSTLEKLDSTLILSVDLRPVVKKRGVTHNASNYARSLVAQHSAPKKNRVVEVFNQDGKPRLYYRDMNTDTVITAHPTRFMSQKVKAIYTLIGKPSTDKKEDEITIINEVPIETEEPPVEKNEKVKKDPEPIDIDNYLFQSEFDEEEKPAEVQVTNEDEGDVVIIEQSTEYVAVEETPEPQNKVTRFRSSRIVPYRLKFRTDFVTTQLDNSLLFGGLDSYAGERQEYSYPPPGILLKANFKDLFEDYELEGGIRVPTTFNGAEYFLLFDDKKKRMDKRYAFYRRALRFNNDLPGAQAPGKREETVVIGQYQLRYPLDIFTSIRGTATLRFDKNTQLATDAVSLNTPSINQQRAGIRLEYVFDNTLDVAINIKNGTRYKVFAEVVKRFQVDLLENTSFDFNDGFMTILGVDARHYQRLDKHSIFAARFAAQTSFGSERILYFLGGVDNWLFPSFNNEIPFPTGENFAYQTLASNMRGFRNNIRNGSAFALLNTELRVPVFKYFSRRLKSSFLRNFQVVGFFDVGTAWTGANPFSEENPLNTINIDDPRNNIFVKVNYFRDPIVAGYGAGVRSMLFGYFIRLDYAWGIETRVVQDPRFYLSLGMDF